VKQENKLVMSLFILSFSILLGSIILAVSINNLPNKVVNVEIKNENVLSLEEAADYLGITTMSLEKTVERTSIGLPFLKLEENYIFTKKGLDEWLVNNHIDLD
jgi:hypothetical protein